MKDYIEKAIRTESPITEELKVRVVADVRGIHAFFGLLTEVGELADGYKRAIFYGKQLDTTNIKEEVGDVLWYLAILMDELGINFEECMAANIAKLKKRYPEKYSHEDALNRDLVEERKVLEQKKELDQWEGIEDCGLDGVKSIVAQAGRCPTCDSPEPRLHPAVQFEGEVEICKNAFHCDTIAQAGEMKSPEEIAKIPEHKPYGPRIEKLEEQMKDVLGALGAITRERILKGAGWEQEKLVLDGVEETVTRMDGSPLGSPKPPQPFTSNEIRILLSAMVAKRRYTYEGQKPSVQISALVDKLNMMLELAEKAEDNASSRDPFKETRVKQ